RITIVNHTRATTTVHWHGIEVPSYSDGVAGWSGSGTRTAPAIAPGDSFVASFTPPRSGTFMYHAHANEIFQVTLGLFGALLVVDSTFDAAHERIILLGGNAPGGRHPRINGKEHPDTLRLTAGTTYRLRLINIIADWTTRIAPPPYHSLVHLRAPARVGAVLPRRPPPADAACLLGRPRRRIGLE